MMEDSAIELLDRARRKRSPIHFDQPFHNRLFPFGNEDRRVVPFLDASDIQRLLSAAIQQVEQLGVDAIYFFPEFRESPFIVGIQHGSFRCG